jgi:hypothetical protein
MAHQCQLRVSVFVPRAQGLPNTDQKCHHQVGFQVLTAASMKMAVFWVVAPCSLVEVYRRFRGACWVLIALMMEAASSSETSVNFYQTTRRYNSEDSHLHCQTTTSSTDICCKNYLQKSSGIKSQSSRSWQLLNKMRRRDENKHRRPCNYVWN